jgi:hypothetical protein
MEGTVTGMLIRLSRSIVVACAVFALAFAAHANPILIYNTGVDAAGLPVANGTIGDLHYVLTSVPGGTSELIAITSVGGFPIPPWVGDDSISTWIRPNNSLVTDPEGMYDFRTTFNMTGLDLASAVLLGRWATDNPGIDILINGVSTGIGDPGEFVAWSNTFTIGGGFVAGVNTLDFIVQNGSGSVGNPTGLRVEISGSANAIPEPVSFVLLGAGLGALGMLRRRKA